jgi:toxin YoeB
VRDVIFDHAAFAQYNVWARADKKIHDKIIELIEATVRDPFVGLGKPEPLKHEFKGCWSRRITQDDRLVYKVSQDSIRVLSCKDHYPK